MSLRAILWLAVSTKSQASDEKESLPTQEADAIEVCQRNCWQVVDVLRVPGHSRRYVDIHELTHDAKQKGIDAFEKLLHHFEDCDFDILVVRDGDRFARTQSLHAYIVEKTISIGARIYSLADGMIDEKNFRMWIAMGGYRAAGEIDNLMKRRQIGFDARARRGLPVNSKVVDSHKIIRDEQSGKAIKVVVDESKHREWHDLATLILEGVAWKRMEEEMFHRFGHGSSLNQPYQPHHYYRIVYTPGFWGHNARHFKQTKKGPWIREQGNPIPEDVLMVYDVWEPVYTDELAERVKEELTRRESLKGKARPQNTYRFTGLFLCAECGYTMVYARTPGYDALRCTSRYEKSATRSDCDARKYLSEKSAQEYIDRRLREMLAAGNPSAFLPVTPNQAQDLAQRVRQVEQEITDTEQQIQRMILHQASADDVVYDQYNQAIANAGIRLRSLKAHLKELQQELVGSDNTAGQGRAFDEIVELSVDAFWEQEDRVINQTLYRLLGKKRFVVKDGEIIGVVDKPVRKKRY